MIGFINEPGGSGGGSGITPNQHEALDTLVHSLSETAYQELTYAGANLTTAIYWTDNTKTLKIRESSFTYSMGKVATSVTTQYNGAGTAVQTLTKTFTYSAGKLANVNIVRT